MSKVIIGCKFPAGVLLQTGGDPGSLEYKAVALKGANDGEMRAGGLFVARTIGGFGRTEVDAAFWNAWKTGADIAGTEERNKEGAVLVSKDANRDALTKFAQRRALVDEWQAKGLVFEVASAELAVACATEKAAVRTGFEPLAQANDPRSPKGVTATA